MTEQESGGGGMTDIQRIHDGIIDNPDFNLTLEAKRDLRELCAWVESYRKHGQSVLDDNRNKQQSTIDSLRGEIENKTWLLDQFRCEFEFLIDLPVRNQDWEGYAVAVRNTARRALALESEPQQDTPD